MPSGAAVGMQCLYVNQHCVAGCAWRAGLLGGRLLFVFLDSSRLGSWLEMESLCSTWGFCDMVKNPRRSATLRWEESRSWRSLTDAEDAAGQTFEVAERPSRFSDRPRHTPSYLPTKYMPDRRAGAPLVGTLIILRITRDCVSSLDGYHNSRVHSFTVGAGACHRRIVYSRARATWLPNDRFRVHCRSGTSGSCGGGYRMMQTKETKGKDNKRQGRGAVAPKHPIPSCHAPCGKDK
jgi:hypothetical protein